MNKYYIEELKEIVSGYSLKMVGNYNSQEIALIKYEKLCVKLIQENEKLNHYKLLYQKVKDRNDKAIEFVEELYDNTDDITCYDIDRNTRDDLLEILKGNNEVSNDNN